MTDLLPVYFSGEASEDTKQLVEIYFRENPDFERIARGAAIPLEQLRGTAPVRAEAEREKCDLQWARKEFFRRRMLFGMALFFTCAPLMTVYRNGRVDWTTFLNDPVPPALFWCIAGLFWFLYVARLSRRAFAMTSSIFVALLPMVFVFHLFLPDWQNGLSDRLWLALALWLGATIIWGGYLWGSCKHRKRRP
jgi:heme/copper-type cytochrome/quinol oxidase subunit 4